MLEFIQSISYGSLLIQVLFGILLFILLSFITGKTEQTQKSVSISKKVVIAYEVILVVLLITRVITQFIVK